MNIYLDPDKPLANPKTEFLKYIIFTLRLTENLAQMDF